MALYQCSWRWPGVEDQDQRWQRFAKTAVAADRAQPALRSAVRAWYTYPGEWAGLLILETDSVEALAALLAPFASLMHFDVKPVAAMDYDQSLTRLAGLLGT